MADDQDACDSPKERGEATAEMGHVPWTSLVRRRATCAERN
jgi:hypothetical protein